MLQCTEERNAPDPTSQRSALRRRCKDSAERAAKIDPLWKADKAVIEEEPSVERCIQGTETNAPDADIAADALRAAARSG